MSSRTEYIMIWEHWTKYYDTDNANEKNFEKNMEAFSTRVNGFMEEGWRPLGPPQFSAGWFTGCTNTGSAVWTVIRELDSPQIKHPDNEE